MTKNIYEHKKHVNSSMYPLLPLSTGIEEEKYNLYEQKEDIVDTYVPLYPYQLPLLNQDEEKKSAIVESPRTHKKKIWIDKLNSLEVNTRITELLEILDQESTLKEKVLKPFWTQESTELSRRLWLPTRIDCVDSVLISSMESLSDAPKGKSWFSIKEKYPEKKNSLMTSFPSLQYSLPDSMDLEAINSRKKSKKRIEEKTEEIEEEKEILKTMKFRLFPTEEQAELLQLAFDQFRWYYNATNSIVYKYYGYENIYKKKKYSKYTIRDLVRKYRYEETVYGNLKYIDLVYDEDRSEVPLPPWWKTTLSSRIPRGAVYKYTSSLNAAITNKKEGYSKHFKMNFRSKKHPTDYVHFEDERFPDFIRDIESRYWITTRGRKRKAISLSDLDTKQRSIEIIYEKHTGRYFLHTPVEAKYFHYEDRRIESQERLSEVKKRIIALDPGVRKFLVGYDPTGKVIFFGDGASKELTHLLLLIDKETSKKKQYKLWRRIKNLVNELHWKVISYLIENYDIILLPEFKVQSMIKKKTLPRMVKRLMCMFSFYRFREKLKFKCKVYNKNMIIVDESYTSCTCTQCGHIDRSKAELHRCQGCRLSIDRDVAGSRNIMIKNIRLL